MMDNYAVDKEFETLEDPAFSSEFSVDVKQELKAEIVFAETLDPYEIQQVKEDSTQDPLQVSSVARFEIGDDDADDSNTKDSQVGSSIDGSVDKPFKCDYPNCCKSFMHSRSLQKHDKVHSNERQKCEFCDKSFLTKWSLRRHLTTHNGGTPFECRVCNETFSNKRSLNCHYRTHTEKNNRECKICGQTFANIFILKNHSKLHTDTCTCGTCGKVFLEPLSLKLHRIGVHGTVEPEPEATNQDMIENHFECTFCPELFLEEKILNDHIEKIHGEGPFLHGVVEPQPETKNQDTAYHSENPFQCTFCPKGFLEEKILNDRIEKIHGEGPFLHGIVEPQPETKNHDMEYHSENHFECVFCPEGLMEDKIVGSQGPFSCLICKNSFASERKLILHKRCCTAQRRTTAH